MGWNGGTPTIPNNSLEQRRHRVRIKINDSRGQQPLPESCRVTEPLFICGDNFEPPRCRGDFSLLVVLLTSVNYEEPFNLHFVRLVGDFLCNL